MVSMPGFGPPPAIRPQRLEKASEDWRQALATLLCLVLGLTVFLSVCCLGIYLMRDKPVYEELVDYLDKTIAISKINYNHQMVSFQLSEKELEALADQRTYKTILWAFFFSDLACYVFLVIAILLYFTTDVRRGKAFSFFWIFFGLAFMYCIVEIHIFSFLIFPYSSTLPSSAEKLLNHAIPYNPGGLSQMERRLGCSFDLNLYATQRRNQNHQNTCDPQIASSFLSKGILWTLIVIRLVPIVIFVILVSRKFALSSLLASLMQKIKDLASGRSNKERKMDYTPTNYNTKTTVIGALQNGAGQRSNIVTPQPPISSPGTVDHSISYNNAAYFATSGAAGLNSSRSSEISRSDAIDLYKPVVHTGSSITSEV